MEINTERHHSIESAFTGRALSPQDADHFDAVEGGHDEDRAVAIHINSAFPPACQEADPTDLPIPRHFDKYHLLR